MLIGGRMRLGAASVSVSEIVADIGRDTVKALLETALLFLGAKVVNAEAETAHKAANAQ